jgi:hypothetical protein
MLLRKMKARSYLSWPIALLSLGACDSKSPPPPSSATNVASATSATSGASKAPEDGYKLYGEPLTPAPKVELATLLKNPRQYTEKPVLVEADVRRACTRKGCWMELAESSDPAAARCRVTFKDYGFFVPTDSQGAKARVLGVVEVEEVSARHVQHMEEEGATFANKKADGTAEEVRLVATGVQLKK